MAEPTAPAYIAITGGIGGAKLSLGLASILPPDDLGLVVNTGDDFTHLGLRICPDVDTLVYTLAGVSNPDTGWGCRNESWHFMQALEKLGGEAWFRLGDRDLAMHVERTRRLAAGDSLSQVTNTLAAALGVRHAILPMSDDPVATRVITASAEMDFQHYFVREQCRPPVQGFRFEGAERARVNPQLLAWLAAPSLKGVILCPSNPFVSIDPILALPGLRRQLAECAAPVIAVSPVVGGQAIKGPTVKMMQEMGLPASASWVAGYYRGFLQGFVADTADRALARDIEALGLAVSVTDTVMVSLEDRQRLAKDCLALLDTLGQARKR